MASVPQDRDRDRLESLKKRLEDDPRSLAFVSLAEEHNRLGEYDAAADVAQRGLLTHPDSIEGRLALAVAEAEQNHIREALEQIKRALIIDQENPQALALMGRILLRRGLAKRAVQFLSHAVKLEPNVEEYQSLLSMAKEQVQSGADSSHIPVFSASSVPPGENPWAEDGDEVAPDAEHTVFDPDELRKIEQRRSERAKLDGNLRALPDLGVPHDDEEPTAFMASKPVQAKEAKGEKWAKAAGAENAQNKKAKMGGSAAEYSKMVQKAEADAVRKAAEARVVRDGLGESPAVTHSADSPAPKVRSVSRGGDARGDASRLPSLSSNGAPVAPSASLRRVSKARKPAIESPRASAEPIRGSSTHPSSSPRAESKPAPRKRKGPLAAVGPVATRFVDEAVWGLFGKKSADSLPPAEELDSASPSALPVRRNVGAREEPLVVRTSERFGTWTRVAVVFVLAVTAGFVGHWVTLSQAGPGPEVASEELKGLAVDLERGGLASLLSVEEQAKRLLSSSPAMQPLLDSALAEVYARRYRSFGSDPKMQTEARARLLKVQGRRPTLEAVAAMVELSTSAASRRTLSRELDRTLETYPESPKAWTVRARLDFLNGRPSKSIEALYRALEIHPQHRRTLLELARWFGRRGAYGTAFSFFDQLQENYPTDVEAAIDRYVLGQVSGEDPGESETVSTLAGLVRDEIPEVAKDETGRAALAFAIADLASGEVQLGLQNLEKAEAAYQDSPVFKKALASVFLAVGQFDRAKEHFEAALELKSDDKELQLGLARAQFGLKGEFEIDEEATAAIRKAAGGEADPKRRGMVDLPFGTVRLVPGTFELVRMKPRQDVFPEGAFTGILREFRGEELAKALEARALIVLADRLRQEKDCKKAVELYQEARTLGEEAAGQFGLGQCRKLAGELGAAQRHLEIGLREKPDDVAGRLALVEVLVDRNEIPAALEAIAQLEDGDILSPAALAISSRLRSQRGDFERALQSSTALVNIEPTNAEAWLLRSEAEYHLGRSDDALDSAIRALDNDPQFLRQSLKSTVQTYLIAAAALSTREANAAARRATALLREVVQREDTPPEARFHLGRELIGRRRAAPRREGRRMLERFLASAPNGNLRDEAQRLLTGRR